MKNNAGLIPPDPVAGATPRAKHESRFPSTSGNPCSEEIEKWLESRFFFRDAKGVTLFALKNLIRAEAQKRKTHIYIADRPEVIVLHLGINRLEEVLKGVPFLFRSHRSHIVNLYHLKEYQRQAGLLIMSSHNGENGTKALLADDSRRALQEAMKRLGWREIGGT